MADHGQAEIDRLLTPRERDVLELLRLGLTNAEIAKRLEMSLAGARYHVSEIITKLGVRNRYEAAAWPERVPWWAGAVAPVALLWRRAGIAMPVKLGTAATAASIGLFAVAFSGIGLIGFLLLRAGGDEGLALGSLTPAPADTYRLIEVEGRSMEPTLEEGQRVLVSTAVYGARLPQRGDVIVFTAPNGPTSSPEPEFIKRVIGVPGETVEVRDCTVFVDGMPLDEPYIKEQPRYALLPVKVPSGHYFVLGDSRNNSSDSHSWGMLPEENITGMIRFVLWPLSDFGLVDGDPREQAAGVPTPRLCP